MDEDASEGVIRGEYQRLVQARGAGDRGRDLLMFNRNHAMVSDMRPIAE